jgi:hypothetical protein
MSMYASYVTRPHRKVGITMDRNSTSSTNIPSLFRLQMLGISQPFGADII